MIKTILKIMVGTILVAGLAGCSDGTTASSSASVSEETVYIPEYTDYVSVQECGGYPKYEVLKEVKSYYFDDSGYLVRYVVSDWYDFGYNYVTPKDEDDMQSLAEGMQDFGYRHVYASGNVLVREYTEEMMEDRYISRTESKEDVIANANRYCQSEEGCLVDETDGVCSAVVDFNPDELLVSEK